MSDKSDNIHPIITGDRVETRKLKIKNPAYRKIIDERVIDIITPKKFMETWKTIPENDLKLKQFKYFMFLLFWTGARPSELLRVLPKDFRVVHRGKYSLLELKLFTRKSGQTRVIRLRTSLIPEAINIWKWAMQHFDDYLLFHALISRATTKVKLHGKNTQGTIKTYRNVSRNVLTLCNKYFGVPPYFFRHNRFSDMAEKGASVQEIQYFKGAKTLASVLVYLELSGKKAEDISKYLR